jgi:peptide/nickel transport system substrate-binding protein
LEKKPGFLVHRTLDLNMKYIAFNVGMKPFDNIKVREAIRYSIDYDGIVNDLFKGEGVVQQSIIPFNLLGGNPRKPYKKDIVKAKQLLAEAGYPNGFDTEMWYVAGYPWLETVVPKIQADLAEAGIRVKLVPTTGAEISERRAAQAIPMYILGWGGGLAHPENYVGAWTDYDRKLMAYWMKFDDPKAKELTAKTGIAASDEEAKKIYDELTEYMFQNGPYAVWALLYHHWVSRDYVTRLDVHPVLWLYTIFDTAYKNPPS